MGCSQIAQSFELIIVSRLLVGICAGKETFLVAPRPLTQSDALKHRDGNLSLFLVLVGGQTVTRMLLSSDQDDGPLVPSS